MNEAKSHSISMTVLIEVRGASDEAQARRAADDWIDLQRGTRPWSWFSVGKPDDVEITVRGRSRIKVKTEGSPAAPAHGSRTGARASGSVGSAPRRKRSRT